MGLFKPSWKTKNPQKRLSAAKAVTDQEILKKLAATDPVLEIRLAVIDKITDEQFLAVFANEMQNDSITMAVMNQINDTELLFALAVSGKSTLLVEQAALGLATRGDKRVITHYEEILRQGGFGRNGSLGISEFEQKIIRASGNILSEETVAFLENYYLSWGQQRRSYTASLAQKGLRTLLRRAGGTPLAERIRGIKDLDIDVKYEAY